MKVLVPEIATHVMEGGEGRNQEILSVDAHPALPVLVSAGAGENRVILWKLNTDTKEATEWLTFLAEMTATTFENTVNIVRFSPCGKYLACGDSNGLITILSLKEECKSWTEVQDERNMRRVHLRGHTMDVQDFAWSPDSLYCASAAMDNFVIIWDVLKCTEVQRIKDHTHYAQGVSWSPDGQFLASASFDETVRINRIMYKSKKVVGCQELAVLKKPKLFADEFRAPTFSRRLAFSPETWSGLLVTPGGLAVDPTANTASQEASSKPEENNAADGKIGCDAVGAKPDDKKTRIPAPSVPATHVFRLVNGQLPGLLPAATFSGFAQPSLAIRFHPSTFLPIEQDVATEPWASFVTASRTEEARFVFAVATMDSVLVYDTQHVQPIAAVEKLHYASYTDLAWNISPDGASALIASSRDGCFSIMRFEKDELGRVVEKKLQQPISIPEESGNDGSKQISAVGVDANPDPSTPAKERSVTPQDENSVSSQASKKRRIQVENLGGVASNSPSPVALVAEKPVNTLQPRRVQLQTIKPL